MVFHQSFVTKEPINVHRLCRTLLSNFAIASALAYIKFWFGATAFYDAVNYQSYLLAFCCLWTR